jgi:hypothetical protein
MEKEGGKAKRRVHCTKKKEEARRTKKKKKTLAPFLVGNLHLMFEYLEQFKDHLSIHRVNESKDQVFTMFESLPIPE